MKILKVENSPYTILTGNGTIVPHVSFHGVASNIWCSLAGKIVQELGDNFSPNDMAKGWVAILDRWNVNAVKITQDCIFRRTKYPLLHASFRR